MTERRSYRTQYENRVAELGTDTEDQLAPDEEDVRDAREMVEEFLAGELEPDNPRLLKARQIIDRYEQHLAYIRHLRLTVCAHALDVPDALNLMEHLGIAPHQPLPRVRINFTPLAVTSPRNITRKSS